MLQVIEICDNGITIEPTQSCLKFTQVAFVYKVKKVLCCTGFWFRCSSGLLSYSGQWNQSIWPWKQGIICHCFTFFVKIYFISMVMRCCMAHVPSLEINECVCYVLCALYNAMNPEKLFIKMRNYMPSFHFLCQIIFYCYGDEIRHMFTHWILPTRSTHTWCICKLYKAMNLQIFFSWKWGISCHCFTSFINIIWFLWWWDVTCFLTEMMTATFIVF